MISPTICLFYFNFFEKNHTLEKKHQMKKIVILSSLTLIVTFAISLSSHKDISNPSGGPAGNTGSPADGQTCAHSGCHSGTATTVASGILSSSVPSAGYTPGTTYNIMVSHTGTGKKGFQVSPQTTAGLLQGSLIAGTGNKIVSTKYVTHNASNSANPCTWTFKWIAPAAGTGDVTFYGVVVLGTNSTKKTTLVVHEASTTQGVSNESSTKLSVYPNPVIDQINIKLTDETNAGKAMLFDLNGELILTENFESNEFSMNVSNISAGNYYLRINDGKNQYFKHIVIK